MHVWDLVGMLFFKKLLISSNKVLEIPIYLSLKISPSCHTLSKAFDISKKHNKIQGWDKYQTSQLGRTAYHEILIIIAFRIPTL